MNVETWIAPDGRRWEYPADADADLMRIIREWFAANGYVRQDDAPDLLDLVASWDLGFVDENLGGGLGGLVAWSERGTVVVTDDGDAVLIGFYPGDNWGTGEDQGNELETGPIDDAAVLRGIVERALERLS